MAGTGNPRIPGSKLALGLAVGLGLLAGGVLTRSSAQAAPTARRPDRALEAANKKVVLDMWHEVINGRNIDAAPKYIAPGYIQHSPSAGQGLQAVMDFFRNKEFKGQAPKAPGTYPLTKFEFVLAEGDLVQLMFRRKMADPHDATKTVEIWWYDTYRLKDGMIVEHWDCATE
jgi:predicted SnoaL-like aldol condensation-catalyzing enzyme